MDRSIRPPDNGRAFGVSCRGMPGQRSRVSPRPKIDSNRLTRRYSAELRRHLARNPGASSRRAESLGREALEVGLDTTDLVRLHERALVTMVPSGPSPRDSERMFKRAANFFVGALAPYEDALRAAVKSNGDLRLRNVNMGRQAVELAAARRKLRGEIARREALQKALSGSERHYRELLEKSRRMQEHLRRLAHEILSAQEDERRKISRELHDEIGQILTAINVRLTTLTQQSAVNATGLKKHIASTQRLVEKSMDTVHRFARELRPALLDDLGLIPALHAHMKEFTRQSHVMVRFKAFAGVEEMDSDRRTVLYRVAQEAMNNVARHANASRLDVSIRKFPGVVRMEIHDDGKSFDVARAFFGKRIKRLGLLGMRERIEMVGGNFEVTSEPGKGTTVRAEIPFRERRSVSRTARIEPTR